MKVLLLGATGMVGQGVLRECLIEPRVTSILTMGRAVTGLETPKLREIAQSDLFDLSAVEAQLTGIDVCFFCLGVSAVGTNEAQYTRITHDLTLSVAHTLLRLNPALVFLYVSGMGTDSTERGGRMWARVKGRTENDLLAMSFRRAYMVRPAAIVPLRGIRSKTALYRAFYTLGVCRS
jgi:uncharacterized protein YbjT (DUF2867 family)